MKPLMAVYVKSIDVSIPLLISWSKTSSKSSSLSANDSWEVSELQWSLILFKNFLYVTKSIEEFMIGEQPGSTLDLSTNEHEN